MLCGVRSSPTEQADTPADLRFRHGGEPTDTQLTKPQEGEPVEIPVPPKGQIMGDGEKIATTKSGDDENGGGPRQPSV
jgi:hypothetical protein